MKKTIYFVMAALLCSCAGKGNQASESVSDSDSVLTAEMESPEAGNENYFLTADSIGPVHVGEQIARLPEAVANLYDTVLPTETPDAMAYTYLLGDIPQFTVYDFMEGKVDVIVLEGDARAVTTPDGELRVGDEFSKVFALKGVKSEYQALDDMGVWYWQWNGLWFGVDESNLSRSLSEALCNGQRPPRASEFKENVRIGYIGTGLPF